MIKVEIKKQEGKIKEVLLKGHAMYDDYGKDIVCAGVSSIFITTVNAILKFDQNSIKVIEEKNKVTLRVLKESKENEKLIGNMLELLQELSQNYPKNITIREDENNE